MARQVNYEKPTEKDLSYLSQRGWLVADAELRGITGIKKKVADYVAGKKAEAGEQEQEQETVTYAQGTVDQLRAELERRDLSTEGKKAELVARLEKHDEENEEEDVDPPAGQ